MKTTARRLVIAAAAAMLILFMITSSDDEAVARGWGDNDTLAEGDAGYDFTLASIDGESYYHLAEPRDRPTVLFFTSYT